MLAGSVNAHVDFGVDKVDDAARETRWKVVGDMAPKTPLYQADAGFHQVIDDYTKAGAKFVAANALIATKEAELDQARSDRDEARKVVDKCHGAAAKQVELHSVTPADLQSYGFVWLDKVTLGLVIPSKIDLRYDLLQALLHVHVKWSTPGTHRCVIEISPTPGDPASWVRLDGTGVKRALTGYAPGTWYLRAATAQAQEHSKWAGPFAVVVK